MRKRRDMETFNLSFLDVVCCGFGAVILLLVITKIYEPVTIQKSQEELQKLIVTLEQELNLIRGESTVLNQTLTEVREQLSENDEQKNRLTGDLSELQGEFTASKALADEKTAEMNGLLSAKQSMTEIMRRLLKDYRPKDETTVGGIPVDSEYIIFVIDTSGSMTQGPWNLVIQKITETLAVYPKLKGIQVLNDEGEYMFSSYAGRWIPDSPSIRKNITSRLQYWNPYSDSSPVEGITEAINTFYDRDKKISIYVFGDDFPRGSVEAVCRYVARINKADRFGNRLVRIHGIGFPTQIGTANGAKFAHLMRKLSEQNGGTFVALPHL
tara:strand:+ start:3753 stop:4730 length:978 start_codon:yes stop_codon:yes gene_type:complete